MWISLEGKRVAITFRSNGQVVNTLTGEELARHFIAQDGHMIIGKKVVITKAQTKDQAVFQWAEVVNGEKQQCVICKLIGKGMRNSKWAGGHLCKGCDQPGVLFRKIK